MILRGATIAGAAARGGDKEGNQWIIKHCDSIEKVDAMFFDVVSTPV